MRTGVCGADVVVGRSVVDVVDGQDVVGVSGSVVALPVVVVVRDAAAAPGAAVGLADAARTASTLPQIARGRIKPDRRLAVVLATICVLSAETDNPDTISRGNPPRRPSLLHLAVARRQASVAAPPSRESDN